MYKKIVDSFIRLVYGSEPSEFYLEDMYNVSSYLLDNGFNENKIFDFFSNCDCSTISLANLPEELWENSLLSPNRYYYHSRLHNVSKPPKWNPVTLQEEIEPFYVEMVLNFTINDLLDYYYNTLLIPIELRDAKKDIGGLEYLLRKYTRVKVSPIDFVLSLIDASRDYKVTNVLDIQNQELVVYEYYEDLTPRINPVILWRGNTNKCNVI